jgi:hypothetical protein
MGKNVAGQVEREATKMVTRTSIVSSADINTIYSMLKIITASTDQGLKLFYARNLQMFVIIVCLSMQASPA